MSGLLAKLFRKKSTPNYSFTEEDRELSKQLRAKRKELKLKEHEIDSMKLDLKLAEIEDRLNEFRDDDEETASIDGMFEKAMMSLILSKMNPQTGVDIAQVQTMPGKEKPVDLSDEQIEELKKTVSPMHLQMAKALPDAVLERMVKERVPFHVSDQTVVRAIEILRTE